jgi:hypothetical protein
VSLEKLKHRLFYWKAFSVMARLMAGAIGHVSVFGEKHGLKERLHHLNVKTFI